MARNRRSIALSRLALFLFTLFALFAPFASFAPDAQAIPAKGHELMVAGPSPHAIEIARDVHLRGGNVVDTAVAMILSMAVTHPYYAAFGGGGFAVVKMDKGVECIDFREMAPARANADFFKGQRPEASVYGGKAVGVPGVPAGLWELHRKYGKLKWPVLFEGALRLAEQGFRVSGEWAEITAAMKPHFNDGGRKHFFRAKDVAYKPGEILRQPGLANFMRRYRDLGPKGFYEGPVADELVAAVHATSGAITRDDLSAYKVRWLQPIKVDFLGGYKLNIMPPPGSGGVIIAQAARLMEKLKLQDQAPLSVNEFHLLAEILKLSYRGRALLGDPDFAKNPIAELTDEKYLSKLAAMVKMDHAIDPSPIQNMPFEKEQTTHISVLDAHGNAVALTLTLNGNYGSGVVLPMSGIALNNEMDDFTARPGEPNMYSLIQGENNVVRAGARPLSSMTPTIVEKNGRTVMVVGAPGGPKITSSVLQVMYRALIQNFDIDQAIQAPRVHHQFLPNTLIVDRVKFTPETLEALKSRGHTIESGHTGRVYGVKFEADGLLSGAADARGEGAAGGI